MEETASLFSLTIDPSSKAHLSETAKWARFLAIVGFVFILFMVIVGVYSSLTISRYEDMFSGYNGRRTFIESLGVGVAITYIIIAAVAFFPFLFMLRFANEMRRALSSNNQTALNASFQNLKVYFRYLGIILIVCLVMMALSLLIGIFGRAL
jgi:hypothetical protein